MYIFGETENSTFDLYFKEITSISYSYMTIQQDQLRFMALFSP